LITGVEILQSQLEHIANDYTTYDRRMKQLVANLVRARNLQPIDNAIVQDIDDAIDALVSFTGIVVLVPRQ
jgi:hypothetical protein